MDMSYEDMDYEAYRSRVRRFAFQSLEAYMNMNTIACSLAGHRRQLIEKCVARIYAKYKFW